ncbi:O-acetyl-ADP-ribose deacetylase [Tuberibacillus sp. Marseille-P3662]|uniref:O-acetyl-ADP-ribose deacetylase n=1 Tax=Tuberibacillus sp. Marseille-P3662 TaxID=1965358 RepID=UPI000A1C7CE1|nr:O-acetyl-ADP-ribose deacetylase [Tuberibacillus sp. Marseille-P3662]
MSRLNLLQADITKLDVDAIVNAANESLLGGGGVDGAIHKAGGPQISQECQIIKKRQNNCPTGDAVYTSAGDMPSRYVIHTVGPVWSGDSQTEQALLQSCYDQSLMLAEQLDVETIAFPNISTGVYGYPKQQAADVAIQTVKRFFQTQPESSIRKVFFVCYDEENYQLYKRMLKNREGSYD